jgi:RHS repeat-associated protein
VTYNNPAAVPSAPQYLTTYPGNAQATMVWSPPTFGGSPPLSDYYLQTYVLVNNAWSFVRDQTTCATCTSAVITSLANGSTYLTYVFSQNTTGIGGYQYVVYTPAGPPGAPRFAVANAANGGANVRWAPPADNGGAAVDGYFIAAYDSVGLRNYVTVCGTCTSTFVPSLVNGTGYSLYIYAHNGPGQYGTPELSNAVTPGATDPMAGAGERADFTQQTFSLTDRMTAKVNLGTGNLELAVTDLVLPAVGGSLPLGRVYNSMAPAVGSSTFFSTAFGYDWRFNQAPDVRLIPGADGSVAYDTPSGNVATFAPAGANFTTPAGLDATLVRAGDGTYTLTLHASAEVLRFGTDGNLASDTDRNANTLSFAYPDGRRVATITSTAGTAPGNTVTIDYSGTAGRVATMSQTADGVTRTVRYTYESTGIGMTSVTDVAGGVTSYTFDGVSNLTSLTDPAGRVTQFSYDASHRVTSITRVVTGGPNAVTSYDYSVVTPVKLTKVTDADGHPPVNYAVDSSGRVTAVTDAKGKATSTTYIADAKVGSVTNATGGTTTNTFGANSGESLTLSTGPTGATVSATYNVAGQPYLPGTVTDTMGKASTLTYSGPGNLASTANALAATARLSYNGDGTVATATDPGGGVTTYGYNGTHQLVSITPLAPLGAQSFTYDGAGRTRTAVNGGVTSTYSYDAANRVTAEAHSDATPALSYAYDAAGNLTSRTDASGTTAFAYDVANHLTRKTLPGGAALAYTYDGVGNLSTSTDAGGPTAYHYDTNNLLDQLTEPGGRTDIFAYDADHRRTDTWDATAGPVAYDGSGNVIPPTVFAAHIRSDFDNAGQLTRLKTTRASSNVDANRVGDLTYGYTVPTGTACAGAPPAGQATALRQTMSDNLAGPTTAYCYDGGGRLLSATTTGGPTYAYAYDPNGNRTTGPEGTHSFNSVNEATDASSAYDNRGNLTASAAFPAAAYNGVGQATSITASGQSALAMAYAGTTNAERTVAGATTYQNGLLGVQDQTTAGTTTSYVSDPQGNLVAERIGPDEYYYAFDGIGSVVALIDATGTQRAAYTYDPYGGHATATGINGAPPPNPWRYAGGALDSTGLYHFGARYYDPTIGRWTQQDSVVAVGDPSNGNRYAYAGDDPANFVDPDGRFDIGPIFDAENAFKVVRKAFRGKNLKGKDFLGDLADTGTGIILTTGCVATLGAATAELGGIGAATGLGACAAFGSGVGRVVGHAIDQSNGVK